MNPVLLLHGALGCSNQLKSLRESLTLQDRDVLELNFSGHGGEPFQPNFGIEQFAKEVVDFLANQKMKTVDIFGYSMGGYVACWLAYKHPSLVNRIVTLGTKFDWSPESAKKEVTKMDSEKIQAKVPAFARLLETRHAPNDWKVLMARTSEMMLTLGNTPLLTEPILRSIKSETIIVLGELDDMADREYSELVSSWIPKSKFKLFSNTPHPIEKVEPFQLVMLITT